MSFLEQFEVHVLEFTMGRIYRWTRRKQPSILNTHRRDSTCTAQFGRSKVLRPQVLAGSGVRPKRFPHELTQCRNMTKCESSWHTSAARFARPKGNCPACTGGLQMGFRSTAKQLAPRTGGFQMTKTTSHQQHHQTSFYAIQTSSTEK